MFDYIVLFKLIICLLVAMQGTTTNIRVILKFLSGCFASKEFNSGIFYVLKDDFKLRERFADLK